MQKVTMVIRGHKDQLGCKVSKVCQVKMDRMARLALRVQRVPLVHKVRQGQRVILDL